MTVPSAAEATRLALKVVHVYGTLCVMASVWLYAVARKARPGWQRLVSASPALLGFLFVVPCFFSRDGDEGIIGLPISLMAALTSLKIVAYILNRGPLADAPPGFLNFYFTLNLSVTPVHSKAASRHAQPDEVDSTVQLLLSAAGNILMWLVCAYIAARDPPVYIRHPALFFYIAGTLAATLATHAAVARGVLGMRVAAGFAQPWWSPTLSDFWARRWNVATARLLKALAYDTVMEGCLVAADAEAGVGASAAAHGHHHPSDSSSPEVSPRTVPLCPQFDSTPPDVASLSGTAITNGTFQGAESVGNGVNDNFCGLRPRYSAVAATTSAACIGSNASETLVEQRRTPTNKWRSAAGVFATFALSGLFHEQIVYYITGAATGHWFWFFFLQAPLVLVEKEWLMPRTRPVGGGKRTVLGVPRPLAAVLVLLVLEVVAWFTWWPVLESSGMLYKMVAFAR